MAPFLIRVVATAGGILIDGRDGSFVAGTLQATLDPGGSIITITNTMPGNPIVVCDYAVSRIGDGSGNALPTAAAAMAYLASTFAMRPQGGDLVSTQVAISRRGQTVIPLQQPPTSFLTARLIVNGAEYRSPDIAISAVAVTWLNPDFDLEPTDRVTVVYA